jgi:hypothetical protein
MPESSGSQTDELRTISSVDTRLVETQNLGGTLQRELLGIKNPQKDIPALRERMRNRYTLAKDKNKDNPDRLDVVDAYYQLLCGPLLLDDQKLYETNQAEQTKMPTEELILSASIQHRLTKAVLQGTFAESSEAYKKNIYDLISGLDSIAKTKYGQTHKLGRFLSGLRSEIAIIRQFLPTHTIYFPSYKRGSNEVLEWDIRDKVDFIAIPHHKGPILLVDAKGRHREEVDTESGTRYKEVADASITVKELKEQPLTQESTQKFVEEHNPDARPVYRFEVIVPTSGVFMGGLTAIDEAIPTSEYYQKKLQGFGSLNSRIEDTITDAIDNLE